MIWFRLSPSKNRYIASLRIYVLCIDHSGQSEFTRFHTTSVATGHTIGAFLMLAFFVSHLYLVTTGHTVTAHIKAMITGWEEVDSPDEAPARPENI